MPFDWTVRAKLIIYCLHRHTGPSQIKFGRRCVAPRAEHAAATLPKIIVPFRKVLRTVLNMCAVLDGTYSLRRVASTRCCTGTYSPRTYSV